MSSRKLLSNVHVFFDQVFLQHIQVHELEITPFSFEHHPIFPQQCFLTKEVASCSERRRRGLLLSLRDAEIEQEEGGRQEQAESINSQCLNTHYTFRCTVYNNVSKSGIKNDPHFDGFHCLKSIFLMPLYFLINFQYLKIRYLKTVLLGILLQAHYPYILALQ